MDWQSVAEACHRDSIEGRTVFPAVLARLAAAGVERYRADLARGETVYYRPEGEAHVVADARLMREVAAAFAAAGVESAIRGVQAGQLAYPAFCDAIAAAGCADYLVSLAGRRAVYSGRNGEAHVEPFPAAP